MCEILDEVAVEAAINTTIEVCKDFGLFTEETIKSCKKFHISEDTAMSRVKEHWDG